MKPPLNFDAYENLFDKYPHIRRKVDSSWGSAEMRKFIIELLSDSRGGTRVGFPPADAAQILSLLKVHDDSFPQYDTTDAIIVPFVAGRSPGSAESTRSRFSLTEILLAAAVVLLLGAIVFRFVITPLIRSGWL
jgi:hypothetical protein